MENIDSKIIKNEAGTAGLAIGCISGAYVFISFGFFDFLSGHILANWLIWGAKTFACIYLMAHFIKALGSRYRGVELRHARSFGTLAAFFSALITALCQYAALEWCFPDLMKTTLDASLSTMQGMLDSNSMAAIDGMLPKFPVYSMIGSLIWCFIFGWIVTLISSANIYGRSNPFDRKDDDDDII